MAISRLEFVNVLKGSLSFSEEKVWDTFKLVEQEGVLVVSLLPRQRLSTDEFKIMCAVVRDHGGPDYIAGSSAWRVPLGSSKTSGGPLKNAEIPPDPQLKAPLTQLKPGPYTELPLSALLSLPYQARNPLGDVELAELAESIKEHGVLEPILVRPKANGLFEIVMGERRVRAASMAGLVEIPAIVREMNDREAYERQFTENIQRKDLTDLEKARWIEYMLQKFGGTQRELAQKMGKSEVWISKHLSLLNLEKLSPGKVPESITERQARELARAPDQLREEILHKAAETGELPSSRAIRGEVEGTESTAENVVGPQEGSEGPEHATEIGEEQGAESTAKTPPGLPVAKAEKIDTGLELDCPVCHRKYQIIHVKNVDGVVSHRFEAKA